MDGKGGEAAPGDPLEPAPGDPLEPSAEPEPPLLLTGAPAPDVLASELLDDATLVPLAAVGEMSMGAATEPMSPEQPASRASAAAARSWLFIPILGCCVLALR
jgi:hypothetical protein